MPFLSPSSHVQAFKKVVRLLIRHWQLTLEMTKRDIGERYAGQVFGIFWAVGHPIILMAVYLFIFAIIFKVAVGGTTEMPLDYSTYLLSGLIPWLTFQEAMARSSVVITGNSNLVKQVVFPIEVLPVKAVFASLPSQMVSSVILVGYVAFRFSSVPWTYALIPLVLVLQGMTMIGTAFILAALGVYFRDLKDFIQVFLLVGMYLLPVFYLPDMVPALFRPVLYLNPFSYMIWCFQDVFFFGRIEHPFAWPIFILGGIIIFYCGEHVFSKLKITFGNAL